MIYIFSDIHLVSEQKDWELSFLNELEKMTQSSQTEKVILLGDILNFCVGKSNYWLKVYPKFFKVIKNTKVPILFVEGNHDFFLAPLLKRLSPLIACFPNSYTLKIASKRIHMTHGDAILETNPARDIHKWHPLMQWRAVKCFINLFPGIIHWGYEWRTKRKKHRHHDAHRYHSYVQQYWENQYDGVIMGHSHIKTAVQNDEGRFYLNCGLWSKNQSYFCLQTNPWKIIEKSPIKLDTTPLC